MTIHFLPLIYEFIHFHEKIGMPTTLKKINGNDIAKIASGQVIINLKSVVKELIENALVLYM